MVCPLCKHYSGQQNFAPPPYEILNTPRVVYGSDGPAGRGRVTILPDFGGSGQHFGFISFFTDYFLVPESI